MVYRSGANRPVLLSEQRTYIVENMDIAQAVEHFKKVKEHTPCALPLVLYLEKDGEFIANIISPFSLTDSKLSAAMMLVTLAAFNADKAIFVCEVNAQHVDTPKGLNPDDDPMAVPAVLVIEGQRTGSADWILSPYGVGDDGELAWKEGQALQSTLTGPIISLITEAWGMGDQKVQAKEVIALLHANEYQMIVHRSVLEV